MTDSTNETSTSEHAPNADVPHPSVTRSPLALLIVVGFSVFVAADDLTVVSTMLRPILGDLGLVLPDGLNDAAWIVNAYLIAFIAIMPIAGRISDVIGRRRAFVGAYVLFLLGTIVVPLSVMADEPFGWFLFGRILTAIGGGAMVPVALAVVSDVYPEGQRARALGTLGAIETLGWVWGPLYGAVLVRFLSWEWQFWLNVPLAVAGLAASWWALSGLDSPDTRTKVDWLGAGLLTTALVSLNIALLSGAEIQGVSGLDELTGAPSDLDWLYLVAVVSAALFVWQQSRSTFPLFERAIFRGRTVVIALVVNLVVGAGLVIAMVDVPLFVNALEVDLERAAVVAGWILSAMTAAMAVTSYVGGRVTERWWYRPPVIIGVGLSVAAFVWMGATWHANPSYAVFAVQLGLLGAGFGLTVAPTTSAIVDAAPHDQRGAAASIVMVARLLGFSIGLSALTAWGLSRFQALRATIELPPITDPGFEAAVLDAQQRLTAQAIAETFSAAAVVLGVGLVTSFAMQRLSGGTAHVEPGVLADVGDGSADDLAPRVLGDHVGALRQRVQLLVGGLGVALLLALGAIWVLAGQMQALQAEISAARADAATARADVERVEAGAALYASQIQGFQQQITRLQPQVSAGVNAAVSGLREFGDSTISFDVAIDQTIPIKTEVVIDRVVKVPIKTALPLQQSFDTTIKIATPLGQVPVDVTVPVDVEVPIDLVVDIPINETVPIDETFPVKLDVPIKIDVADTELKTLTDSLAAGLESLQGVLQGLGTDGAENGNNANP